MLHNFQIVHVVKNNRNLNAFTLIELILVVLLLAILAAIAIPNFVDFKKDAKNGEVHEALIDLRASLLEAAHTIQSKTEPDTQAAKYPTLLELQSNQYSDSHLVLKGTQVLNVKQGMPKNPWSLPILSAAEHNVIVDCGSTKSVINNTPGHESRGWCYSESTGEIWANSNLNGAEPGKTENFY